MELIVMTRTPLRVSFLGGGTDLPEYYESRHGAVVSTAINKYVYVTVKPHGRLFDEAFRINYSRTEQTRTVAEIENDIARGALLRCDIETPLYISTVADLPSGSGLGSSSSFAVGLLHALHAMKGERVTPGQLAAAACHLEIDTLRKPIGKQDQFAAAYGGLNHIRFRANGRVSITPITLTPRDTDLLFSHLLMFWTGISRSADDVLSDQRARTGLNMTLLDAMLELTEQGCDLLHESPLPIARFGALMHQAWTLKQQFSARIAGERIRGWYQRGIDAGAYGGKLCGAGGGGFLLFCAPPDRHAEIADALHELTRVEFGYDPLGTCLLFPGYFDRT